MNEPVIIEEGRGGHQQRIKGATRSLILLSDQHGQERDYLVGVSSDPCQGACWHSGINREDRGHYSEQGELL